MGFPRAHPILVCGVIGEARARGGVDYSDVREVDKCNLNNDGRALRLHPPYGI